MAYKTTGLAALHVSVYVHIVEREVSGIGHHTESTSGSHDVLYIELRW